MKLERFELHMEFGTDAVRSMTDVAHALETTAKWMRTVLDHGVGTGTRGSVLFSTDGLREARRVGDWRVCEERRNGRG